MTLLGSWRQSTYTSSNGICIKPALQEQVLADIAYTTLHVGVYVEGGNFLINFVSNFYIFLLFCFQYLIRGLSKERLSLSLLIAI